MKTERAIVQYDGSSIIKLPCPSPLTYWHSSTTFERARRHAMRLARENPRRLFAVLDWENGRFQPVELERRLS